MDSTYIQERITKTKAQIEAIEDALIALSGGVQSYRLDTGQSTTQVTRFNIDELNKTLDSLYNRLTILENRLSNRGVQVGRPAW